MKYVLLAGLLTVGNLTASPPTFKILEVEDGDTLLLEIDGQPARVQLMGIDAPEDVANPKLIQDGKRTGLDRKSLLALGRLATDHLQSLAPVGGVLVLEGDLQDRDKYGRIPAVARLEGVQSLNEAMVANGFAIVMDRFPLEASWKQRLSELERRARNNGKGLWGSTPHSMTAWSNRDP